MRIDVRWGSATHPGCVRTQNQDATLAGPSLFVVADGMGGHAAGDVASGLAVAALAGLGADTSLHPQQVIDGVRSANDEIRSAAVLDPSRENMGTTVAGVALVDSDRAARLLVFNLGDSRVYRWHLGALTLVTNDHSLVGEMVQRGELTSGEARTHPRRNVVTRALGIDAQPQVDSWLIDPVPGDRYLICSDGLTNEVGNEELSVALGAGDGPQSISDGLLKAALDRGARDNVSVVVLEVVKIETDGGEDAEDTNPRLALDTDVTLEPVHLRELAGGLVDVVPSSIGEGRKRDDIVRTDRR